MVEKIYIVKVLSLLNRVKGHLLGREDFDIERYGSPFECSVELRIDIENLVAILEKYYKC